MNLFDKLLRSRAATTIFLLAAIGAQTPHAVAGALPCMCIVSTLSVPLPTLYDVGERR